MYWSASRRTAPRIAVSRTESAKRSSTASEPCQRAASAAGVPLWAMTGPQFALRWKEAIVRAISRACAFTSVPATISAARRGESGRRCINVAGRRAPDWGSSISTTPMYTSVANRELSSTARSHSRRWSASVRWSSKWKGNRLAQLPGSIAGQNHARDGGLDAPVRCGRELDSFSDCGIELCSRGSHRGAVQRERRMRRSTTGRQCRWSSTSIDRRLGGLWISETGYARRRSPRCPRAPNARPAPPPTT